MNGIFATRPMIVKATKCVVDTDVAKADGVYVAKVGSWIIEDESEVKHICPNDIFMSVFIPADDAFNVPPPPPSSEGDND